MSQSHGHVHATKDESQGRLLFALLVNVLLTVAQVVGGVVAGSLSLIADAIHNLNDAASLGIAWVARRVAQRPADQKRTFGYERAELIGGLINLTTLFLIALYLMYEAVFRLFEPQSVQGWIVVWVAGVALVVDLGTALLTHALARQSLNLKAAFVHNVSDALASIGVIVAGSLILLFEFYLADLIVTFMISGYMLYQGIALMIPTVRILMESAPPGVNVKAIAEEMTQAAGVEGIHHVHVWALDEHRCALEAHVVVQGNNWEQIESLKRRLKSMLATRHGIQHSTLELESADLAPDLPVLPHAVSLPEQER